MARKKKPAEPVPSMKSESPRDRPHPERIAARAYELYLAGEGGEGRATDDWLAAEELSGGKRD